MKKFSLPTIIMAGVILLLSTTVIISLLNISNLKSQIENFQVEVTGVNNNYSGLQTEIENLHNDYEILQAKMIETNNEYDNLRESHSKLTITNEENKSTIIAMQEEINTLTTINKSLEDEIDNLTATIQTLSAQIQVQDESNKNNDTTDGEEATTPTISNTTSQIVYWVEKGEVWHTTRDCSSLSRSTNIQSGTIEESGKARKCGRC